MEGVVCRTVVSLALAVACISACDPVKAITQSRTSTSQPRSEVAPDRHPGDHRVLT